ncbi:glycosyltransferase [Winogradskyella arenosi]|uniref:Cellulose synthase/poly-beta-1,6-N-acetylglucosamine synthase-like glycosyltransferase n=1 Tax=Winogradskyella arenosi TaxID=533325 RepID=A0A368ZCX7_9FLAO|nr:glycosyltransferase [Winogradskyella arenosi]RCW90886.1 cellulose synthase/poly-beta-1,6-N-acetylglucosamine synthase-like glycosyltransferase [Winogradskyella arenosi]
MATIYFSFIIPVYNRPHEVKELLQSFLSLEGEHQYEIVIVEDGSTESSEQVVDTFKKQLEISYFKKTNSGPGDSRNYGMRNAKGNYFIILDSDVLLPPQYLNTISSFLRETYYDCFGGPDAAHPSFTSRQKAINFAMTSFITTGGIRGGAKNIEDFQPRSFNMGLSKAAFLATGGFGKIHPGEDPDLSLRLKQLGYNTVLIAKAFVYHKRRISWSKFYKQVHKFGQVRPILNQWHPSSKSVVYWLPTVFSLGMVIAVLLALWSSYFLLYLYGFYFVLAWILALISNKNIKVACMALCAISIQFFGYGYGFLKSTIALVILRKTPETAFPHLFFN